MVWSGVMYTIMCFVKWSWSTRTFTTLSSLFGSMVILILVKSTCKRPIGVVDTIRCGGTLDKLPSCCKQCVQDFMDFCTWLVIPGHQKLSHNKDRVWSQPWWPASQWHPFRVATWCVLGTTKSRRSSVLPLGIEHRYKAPCELQNSVDSLGSVYLLHWRHVLPETSLDMSASVPSANPTLHSTSGLLTGLQPSQ